MPFMLSRDRDAWPTIRGFVSQVDLTIKRWLHLAPSDVLELERGEDIDLIASGLISREFDRVVEQIKRRESSITLRSPEAVEAIANFVEHRAGNPGTRLLFRFTTNAKRGLERPELFGDGRRGLDVWESLRSNSHGEVDRNASLDGILDAFRRTTRPDSLNENTWKRFQDFIRAAEAETLGNLIRNMEWATEESLGEGLADEIETTLVSKGYAASENEAHAQYPRLFLHVMKLLTRKGLKTLDAADLKRLTLPLPPSPEDRALLADVVATVLAIDGRIARLETTTAKQGDAIASIDETLKIMASAPPAPIYNVSAENLTLAAKGNVTVTSAIPGLNSRDDLLDVVMQAINDSRKVEAQVIESGTQADRDLAIRNGTEMYDNLSRLIDDWEVEEAHRIAPTFAEWIEKYSSMIGRELTAGAYVLLAEVALSYANLLKNEGEAFDGSRAAAYLERAKNVSLR